METLAVRISKADHALLQEMSRSAGKPMTSVLSEAIHRLRRERLLESTSAAYDALCRDPKAWAEVEAERALWDATLSDGLTDP